MSDLDAINAGIDRATEASERIMAIAREVSQEAVVIVYRPIAAQEKPDGSVSLAWSVSTNVDGDTVSSVCTRLLVARALGNVEYVHVHDPRETPGGGESDD